MTTDHEKKILLNSLASAIRSKMFGQIGGGPKHDHYSDFGWPESLSFQDFFHIYNRNGIGFAAVEAYVSKIWETDPEIFEYEEAHPETDIERKFSIWSKKVRFWQKVSEADRRSMVGDYSGLLIQVADGSSDWSKPLGRVSSLEDVWDLIPAWEGELTPASYEMDMRSPRYGMPVTYSYNESPAYRTSAQKPNPRSLVVHHSRLIIWSSTGDLFGRSILRPGYNALLDIEKVVGGGSEGFWKNARQPMSLDIDQNSDIGKLARSLGVDTSDLGSKLNEIVDDWSKGFDKALVTQGIKPEAYNITMPQPMEFQEGPMQVFAASVRMPVRVLIGNVTGERATTEDEVAWAKRCNSLREKQKLPLIYSILDLFKRCGALPDIDWHVHWDDLTEGSLSEKLDLALKMAEVNSKTLGTGLIAPFSPDEIREIAGYKAEDIEIDEDAEPDETVEGSVLFDPEEGDAETESPSQQV